MKRFLSFLLVAVAFTACVQSGLDEITATQQAPSAETLYVGFEGDDTRIQLNEAGKTTWTKGDLVSVFYRSYDNLKYQFDGETGDRNGTISCIEGSAGAPIMENIITVYPYNSAYQINTAEESVYAKIPNTQYYSDGSYDPNSNIMVACSADNNFYLRNVSGWLKLSLTGDGEVLNYVTVRGNGGEQLAGSVIVDAATAEVTLAREEDESEDDFEVGGSISDYKQGVTLRFDEKVELSSSAIDLYIAVVPQTFAEGITVDIYCVGYDKMSVSTTSVVDIERNHIVPMRKVKFEGEEIADNVVLYTATSKLTKHWLEYPEAVVEHTYDEVTGVGRITFVEGVTPFDYDGFNYATELTSVTLPNSVTYVSTYAFTGCTNLAQFSGKFASEDGRLLVVDGQVVAFAPAGLTKYDIPEYVTSIGDEVFVNCQNLEEVTIPAGVEWIGAYAFVGCESLRSVYCKPITPPAISGYIFTINDGFRIYVPVESTDAYLQAWSQYDTFLYGYDFETGEVVGLATPWVSIGMGTYRDDFLSPLYSGRSGIEIEVEVLQHETELNRYRIKNPFSQENVLKLLGGMPTDMIFTGGSYIEFVVEGSEVYIPSSPCGFKLDVGTGDGPLDFYLASAYADETTLIYGEFSEGVFWFTQPKSIIWHIADGSGNYANQEGLFAVALPGYEIKDYTMSATYIGEVEADGQCCAGIEFTVSPDIDSFKFAVLPGNITEFADVAEAIVAGSTEFDIYDADASPTSSQLSWAFYLSEAGVYTVVAVPYDDGKAKVGYAIAHTFYFAAGEEDVPEIDVTVMVDSVVNITGNESYEENYPSNQYFAVYIQANADEVRSLKIYMDYLDNNVNLGYPDEYFVENYGSDETDMLHNNGYFLWPYGANPGAAIVVLVGVETIYGKTQYYRAEYTLPY